MRTRNWIAVFFWLLLCCVFFCAGNVEAGFVRVYNLSTNVVSVVWNNAGETTNGLALNDYEGVFSSWYNQTMWLNPGERFESYLPDNFNYTVAKTLNWTPLSPGRFSSSGYQNYEIHVWQSYTLYCPVAPSVESLQILLHPTWDKLDLFWAGCGLGLTFAGAALILRIIRQVGRTTPQI